MRALILVFFLVLLYTELWAQNQDSSSSSKAILPWYVQRFKISAGLFIPVNNTVVQVGIDAKDKGTTIDFENDLGMAENVGTFLANFQWRISRRSHLNVNYFQINRSSTSILKRDLVFLGETYLEGSTLNSFFNTLIFQLAYSYSIIAKPKFEAGLQIGTHLVGAKAGVDGNNGSISVNKDFGFKAPLPNLGIWGAYSFSKRIAIKMEGDYFSLTVGEISGSIISYNMIVTYKILNKFDLALGYSSFIFDLDIIKKNIYAHYDWSYKGPGLGLVYSFGKKSWEH